MQLFSTFGQIPLVLNQALNVLLEKFLRIYSVPDTVLAIEAYSLKNHLLLFYR